MKSTVGQDLVQVILDLNPASSFTIGPLKPFILLNGLGGDASSLFSPFIEVRPGADRIGWDASQISSINCNAAPDAQLASALCYCVKEGGGEGDPHIRTLRGARYTLLQQGTFLAWSFVSSSKVDWQLFATYGGPKFTTQGLLLLDKSSGAMELSAMDCTWRSRRGTRGTDRTDAGEWQVMSSRFSGANQVTAFELQKKNIKRKTGSSLVSTMNLQVKEDGAWKKVAKLVVHCRPGNFLDFKLRMYRKKDMDFVGGELGVPPEKVHGSEYRFFSKTKFPSLIMTSDTNFQVSGSWLSLGGSPAVDSFVRSLQGGLSMVQTTCGEEEERIARKTCGKYIHRSNAEAFADCVYDLCHGGVEADAEAAAELLQM